MTLAVDMFKQPGSTFERLPTNVALFKGNKLFLNGWRYAKMTKRVG
jgi:hypothetical protein